jgi:hypothetical protein
MSSGCGHRCFFGLNRGIQVCDQRVSVLDMTGQAGVDQQAFQVVFLGAFDFGLATSQPWLLKISAASGTTNSASPTVVSSLT